MLHVLLSGRPWVRIPPGRPKKQGPAWGPVFCSQTGFEPCPVVNGAPVALQSRALSEPAGECEDPAGEALFAAAQVKSKKTLPGRERFGSKTLGRGTDQMSSSSL